MESDALIWTEFQANDNLILTLFFAQQDIRKKKIMLLAYGIIRE